MRSKFTGLIHSQLKNKKVVPFLERGCSIITRFAGSTKPATRRKRSPPRPRPRPKAQAESGYVRASAAAPSPPRPGHKSATKLVPPRRRETTGNFHGRRASSRVADGSRDQRRRRADCRAGWHQGVPRWDDMSAR